MTPQEQNDLALLVSKYGLAVVTRELANICSSKSQEAKGDPEASWVWEANCGLLETTTRSFAV